MPTWSDDDLQKWKYDLHTAIKHRILTHYLTSWSRILGMYARELTYVDGFAGRGRYATGEPGSPLLALDVARNVLASWPGHRVERFVCHFIEPHPANYANLCATLAESPALSDPRINYSTYADTFVSATAPIIRALKAKPGRKACFFFVDPFGYDDVSMETIRDIMTIDGAEVFINFMFDFINRASGIDSIPLFAEKLDAVYDSTDWRGAIQLSGTEREHRLVELYRQQLRHNGASHAISFRMGDDSKDRAIYYLIHGSSHPKAALAMKDAMVASATGGVLGYAGSGRHKMTPLLNLDAETLPHYLLTTLSTLTFSYDAVIAQTIDVTGTCVDKHYRAALKQLERERQIRVRRITSQGPPALSGMDEITFLPQIDEPGPPVQMSLW